MIAIIHIQNTVIEDQTYREDPLMMLKQKEGKYSDQQLKAVARLLEMNGGHWAPMGNVRWAKRGLLVTRPDEEKN